MVPVNQTSLRIRTLSDTAMIPARAHHDDAGPDLVTNETVTISPGCRAPVGTGIAIALPVGTAGMVCPRSGLAGKQGVTVLNAPGIVDAGYRGEVKVILINHSDVDVNLAPGDRIAQLVIAPFLAPDIEIVDELDDTTRGEDGFGSTGIGATS